MTSRLRSFLVASAVIASALVFASEPILAQANAPAGAAPRNPNRNPNRNPTPNPTPPPVQPDINPLRALESIPELEDLERLPDNESDRPILTGRTVPRELLVLLSDDDGGTLPGDFGVEERDRFILQTVNATVLLLAIPEGQDELALLDLLLLDPRVASVQPNYVYETQGAAPIPPAAAPLPQSTQIAAADPVRVAVIDTGVDRDHPSLVGRQIETANVADPADTTAESHGTALAGIILGGGQLQGLAPQARLLSVRAFVPDPQSTGSGRSNSRWVAKGIDLAVARQSDILNLSFAGPKDPLVALLLRAAHARGVLLVAAAGNAGPSSPPAYPAALPEVLGVTATDKQDRVFESANQGSYVALAAPGVGVLVAAPQGRYDISSGTSLAAAYVSGLAAQILHDTPGQRAGDLATLMTRTAIDLGTPGPDPTFGAGRIDVSAAREAAKAHAALKGG